MKWKYLREHHNRQDKAWKFTDSGIYYSSSDGKASNLSFRAEMQPLVLAAFMDQACHHFTFRIKGHLFRFTDTVRSFAAANNLPLNQAKRIFPLVQEEATERLRVVRARLLRSPLRFDAFPQADGPTIYSWSIECNWQKSLPLAEETGGA